MKKVVIVLFCLFSVTKSFGQFIIPATVGTKMEKTYYDEPIKVVIFGAYDTNPKVQQSFADFVKELGFTNEILLFISPKYPNKNYRDSVDLVCQNAKVGSVLEMKFASFSSTAFFIETSITAIAVLYYGYDFKQGIPSTSKIAFSAQSFKKINKLFHKSVPLNK